MLFSHYTSGSLCHQPKSDHLKALRDKDARKPFHGSTSHDNFPEENNGEKVLLAQVWTGDIGPRDCGLGWGMANMESIWWRGTGLLKKPF